MVLTLTLTIFSNITYFAKQKAFKTLLHTQIHIIHKCIQKLHIYTHDAPEIRIVSYIFLDDANDSVRAVCSFSLCLFS